MTRNEAIEELNNLESKDKEAVHGDADDILLAFLTSAGYADIAEAWEFADKRCGGFNYA